MASLSTPLPHRTRNLELWLYPMYITPHPATPHPSSCFFPHIILLQQHFQAHLQSTLKHKINFLIILREEFVKFPPRKRGKHLSEASSANHTTATTQAQIDTMNAPRRKLLTILTLSGATLWIGKEMIPTRKERVIWGVNGQLDHLNDTVERRREKAFGYVVPESQLGVMFSDGRRGVLKEFEKRRGLTRKVLEERETWRSDYLGHEDAFVCWLTRE
ncbi:hypothetical protein DL98DRAFT_10900 [Cadophora sp. DSE1049]|nr:hypothetical protein DL98DRAFT_10900 [Cadophora sp. DSE1049]